MRIDMQAQGWWMFRGFDLKTGRELWREQFGNGITDVGANDNLSSYFSGTWYMGLIQNSPTLSRLDTMSSHVGWTEYTGYGEAARPLWDRGAPANAQISNISSRAVFTVPGGIALGGGFLVNDSTKGGGSGLLFTTGPFSKLQVINDPQRVEGVYSLRYVSG